LSGETCRERIAAFWPIAGPHIDRADFVISGFGKSRDSMVRSVILRARDCRCRNWLRSIAIVIELGGGLMLIAGWKARWAAAAMFIFTAVAAVIFHNFWAVPADAAQNQMIHFMKNISMLGGLLYVGGVRQRSFERREQRRKVIVSASRSPKRLECAHPRGNYDPLVFLNPEELLWNAKRRVIFPRRFSSFSTATSTARSTAANFSIAPRSLRGRLHGRGHARKLEAELCLCAAGRQRRRSNQG
jgi:putative oxidoreductase